MEWDKENFQLHSKALLEPTGHPVSAARRHTWWSDLERLFKEGILVAIIIKFTSLGIGGHTLCASSSVG